MRPGGKCQTPYGRAAHIDTAHIGTAHIGTAHIRRECSAMVSVDEREGAALAEAAAATSRSDPIRPVDSQLPATKRTEGTETQSTAR